MNKLSKEKRNQLILVALGTIGAIAGLWFCVISPRRDKIKDSQARIAAAEKEIAKVDQVVNEAPVIEAQLKDATARLAQIEGSMAPSSDPYTWINNTIRQFNNPGYRVEMPSIGPPLLGEVTMLPGFPYHQLSVNVSGNAHYFQFGQFVADFENRHPYMRIQNVSLEPFVSPSPEDREKLSFRMDIVALVRPNSN